MTPVNKLILEYAEKYIYGPKISGQEISGPEISGNILIIQSYEYYTYFIVININQDRITHKLTMIDYANDADNYMRYINMEYNIDHVIVKSDFLSEDCDYSDISRKDSKIILTRQINRDISLSYISNDNNKIIKTLFNCQDNITSLMTNNDKYKGYNDTRIVKIDNYKKYRHSENTLISFPVCVFSLFIDDEEEIITVDVDNYTESLYVYTKYSLNDTLDILYICDDFGRKYNYVKQ